MVLGFNLASYTKLQQKMICLCYITQLKLVQSSSVSPPPSSISTKKREKEKRRELLYILGKTSDEKNFINKHVIEKWESYSMQYSETYIRRQNDYAELCCMCKSVYCVLLLFLCVCTSRVSSQEEKKTVTTGRQQYRESLKNPKQNMIRRIKGRYRSSDSHALAQ